MVVGAAVVAGAAVVVGAAVEAAVVDVVVEADVDVCDVPVVSLESDVDSEGASVVDSVALVGILPVLT